ncbi:MAG: hypothetical protein L0207_07220 [Chlamydiae bacterium]|nr:hypothetical protein [Chlamydiota bacterium]
MPLLHICNVNFEWELEQEKEVSFLTSFEAHEVALQLQFLPFWFGAKEDFVGVVHMPPKEFLEKFKSVELPRVELLSSGHFSGYYLQPWGNSPSMEKWALSKGIIYRSPRKDCVKKINSKEFSFSLSPLPGSKLVFNEKELKEWLGEKKNIIVMKRCLGASGRGHYLLDLQKEIDWTAVNRFATKEWEAKRPILCEPWMKRVFDFSTQWLIQEDRTIFYVGATICESDERGRHVANIVGEEKVIFKNHFPILEKQKKIAENVLRQIAREGYFGNVGIDAMIYQTDKAKEMVQPVVEINGRKTMGWAALAIQSRHFPEKILRLSYENKVKGEEGYLPDYLEKKNGEKLVFSKQLFLSIQ